MQHVAPMGVERARPSQVPALPELPWVGHRAPRAPCLGGCALLCLVCLLKMLCNLWEQDSAGGRDCAVSARKDPSFSVCLIESHSVALS